MNAALRSVLLALVFLTGVCLYAFRKVFRWFEELEEARELEPQHYPPPRRVAGPQRSHLAHRPRGGTDSWRVLP